MFMKTLTTCTIYFNNKLDLKYQNDFYSVIAKKNIPKGTMLLIEHPLQYENNIDMLSNVIFDTALNETLYPRDIPENPEQSSGISHALRGKSNSMGFVPGITYDTSMSTKINKNVFLFDKDYILGNIFSKINHSCKPNTYMTNIDYVKNEKYYGLFAIQDIAENEELTLDYCQINDKKKHAIMMEYHNFPCDCTSGDIKKKIIFIEERKKLCEKFIESVNPIIHSLVDNYVESSNFSEIMLNRSKAKILLKDRIRIIKQ